jgi:hypothetical protein
MVELDMLERRRVQRTRVLKGAKIILNDRASLFDCTVHNLTNVGASVHVPSTIGIPEVFALSFDFGRSTRGCRVIWRADDKLGVSFVG